jgi:tryptophan synthase beta subunit
MQAELTAEQGAALLTRLIDNQLPDDHGRYGPFGGCYAPETLVPALSRLAENVRRYLDDADFMAHLDQQ